MQPYLHLVCHYQLHQTNTGACPTSTHRGPSDEPKQTLKVLEDEDRRSRSRVLWVFARPPTKPTNMIKDLQAACAVTAGLPFKIIITRVHLMNTSASCCIMNEFSDQTLLNYPFKPRWMPRSNWVRANTESASSWRFWEEDLSNWFSLIESKE